MIVGRSDAWAQGLASLFFRTQIHRATVQGTRCCLYLVTAVPPSVCRAFTKWVKGQRQAGPAKDALEGDGPQGRPQKRLGRRLEEVAEAVGGGYCRLQTPLKPALGVRGTVAGHRPPPPPPFQRIPGPGFA